MYAALRRSHHEGQVFNCPRAQQHLPVRLPRGEGEGAGHQQHIGPQSAVQLGKAAENRILKTLPKMAKAAQSKDLKAAFVKHEKETRGQVKRLEQVFKIIGKKPQGKTCEAIMGITKEGAEIMTDYKGMPALDAGLTAAAQAVEHYEMSRYGTLRTWAEELGMPDAAALLEATLKEEKATDAALTGLAKTVVNVEAEAEL